MILMQKIQPWYGESMTLPSLYTAITPEEYSYMVGVAKSIILNEEDALDAVQDAALTAWRKRDQFAGKSSRKTWLYKVTVTSSLMLLRKYKKRSHVVYTDTVPEQLDETSQDARVDAKRIMGNALTALTPGQTKHLAKMVVGEKHDRSAVFWARKRMVERISR